MKKFYLFIVTLIIAIPSFAQLTGPKTIPGSYPTIAAAIADLNAVGVGAGGVIFNVAAGYTETISAPLSITATGTLANPILFQKSGGGANPLITAYLGTSTPGSAVQDGIWNLIGSDYVTIDGIDLVDPNGTNPATMEYGYAMFKASTTDGCQYNTIKNCAVTLSRANNAGGTAPAVDGSRAINVMNALVTTQTTVLVPLSAAGTNSFNQFYSNTLQNCNIGIALIGYAGVTPFTLCDFGNDIGGAAAPTGNNILNYGGAVGATNPAAGVRTLAQYNLNVSYNTVNNNNGTGVNHVSTLRGIFINTATSANATISNNSITLKFGGTTSQVSAIENVSGATSAANTINLNNNTIQNCTNDAATTSTWYGIYNNGGSATNLNMNYNTFTGNTSKATSGNTFLIYNNANVPGTINMTNNNLSCSFTNAAAYTGTIYSVYNSSGTTATTLNMNSNNFSNYTFTTATGTGPIYYCYNTNSSANTSISNNTWTNLTINNSGGNYLMYNSPSTQVALNVNNNSIVTGYTRTAASGIFYIYYSVGSSLGTSTQTFSGNNFSNITSATSGAGIFYGFYNTDGASSPFPKKSIFNNTFSNITYNTSGIANVLYIDYTGDGSTGAGSSLYNNTLTNLTFGGTVNSLYLGTITSPTYAPNIYGNVLGNIATTGAASTIYGCYCGASTPGINFYKNKIYGIQAGGATGTAYGFYAASAYFYNIYNNYIGDIKAPTSSKAAPAPSASGIYVSSGSTVNIYYNTVYLNATSSGVNFGTAAIYSSTTPTLTLRNNVFLNLSTPNGAGKAIAYQRSSSTLTNYGALSNNNVFYAGTPGANNLIMYDGATPYQTLVLYKSAVAPRDASSCTENPTFLSTSGSSSTYLHINTTTPTQLESGASYIGTYTDDYDGDLRQGTGGYSGTGTAPDIGADEFEGIPLDVTPPNIVYTALANTSSLLARTLTATITDASGVPTSGIGLPVLYWKKTGDPGYTAVQGVSIGANQYTFTFGAGVAVTNTISYYVVAQDMVIPTPNVGSFPVAGASGFTASPPNCSTPPTTPSSYLIIGAICGSFNVGAAQTYTTLTAAVADLNSKEISCAVTFVLTDATYPSETFPIIINANSGSSVVNTVTIRPATTATISGSSASALIKFNGASYMTIDGSNSGSTDRSLTLTNTVASGTTAVVWVGSLGTGNGSNNITLKNCNISNGYNTLSSYGIFAGSATSIGTAGDDNDNLTIQNNVVSKAYFGIWAQASATGLLNNLQILQNSVGSSTVSSYIGHDGIMVAYTTGSLLSQNTVYNIIPASTTPVGITISTGCVSSEISKNIVNNIIATGTSGYGGRGFYINTNNASSGLTFSNNLVYVIGGDGYSSFNNTSPVGMYFDGTTGGLNIYYNSIYLSGNLTYNTTTKTAGILFNTSTITSIDLRNNIFMNSMNNTANSGAKNYAIYSSTAAGNFTQINYNDYFVTGAQGVLGYIGGSDVTVLSAWQLATGKDGSSLNADPQFVGTTDLRPGLGSPVIAGGTPIAGITTDFLGTVRSVTVPSIGAYEAGVDVTGPVINYTALGNTTLITNRTLTANISDISGVPTSGIGLPVLYWKINGGSWSSATAASLGANQYQFTFGSGVVIGDVVSYYVVAQDNDSPVNLVSCYPSTGAAGFSLNPPAAATPPTTPSTYTIVSAICGTFNVGAAQTYTTLTAAVADLNSKMITCPVVFILKDAVYPSETFPIIINANSGSSVVNTVTIRPDAGITATIAGSSATTLLKLYGADYITIDGLNTGGSTLTFNNSNASGVDIWISSTPTDGSTYNTIKNCSLFGLNGTSTIAGILAGSGATLGNSAETANSNNTIQNNTFKSTLNGIYINGFVTTPFDQNWVVSNNTFGSAVVAEKHGFRGMFIGNASNFTVTNNSILGVQSSVSTSSTMMGIQVGLSINGGTISSNTIGNISQINTGGWGAAGIYLGASTTSSGLNIFNNLIYDVTGYGFAGILSTDNGYGIMIDAGGGYNLNFNTVNMYTSQASAGIPAAINISSGITAVNSVTLKNNIFNIPSSNTTGTRYAIYCSAANTVFSDINYNDYYSVGTLGYLGSDMTTLPAWRTATGKDVNSISADPLFISGTDLHPQQPLLVAGVAVPGITTDYSGITRGTPPAIGAYELPQVITVAASSITQSGATLNGTVNGCNQSVVTSFEYGTTIAYGSTTAAVPTPVSGATTTAINAVLSGLTINTLYHYRAVGTVGSAIYNGADMTFDLVPTPSITSGPTPVCQGSTGNVYVTQSGKANYAWTVSGGGAITLGGGTTDNTVTVTWNSSGAQSVSINYQNSSGVSAPAPTVYNVTVDPTSVGGSIAGGTTVCSGTNSTILTLSGQTGSVNKWQYSTDNWVTSTDVANTTTTLTATNLTLTTKYRAEVQSGTCASTWSGDATITVDPVSVGGLIVGSATVCSGTNSTLLALSGYTGSITKWQYSTDNWVTPVDIANTSNTYTATNLTTTTKYRAVVTSGVCSSVNSTDATVTVDPVTVGGSIAGSATVCSGTNSTLLTLSGYTGSITKWQYSTDNWVTPVDIANTTNIYTATNLTTTTKYRAVITSGVCSSANSADATMTVDPVTVGGSITGSATVCSGTNSTLLTLSGYTGSITKWQKSTDNWVTPVDIVNTTNTYTATNLTTTTKYRAVIQSGVCSAANSSDATVTVDPVTVGGSIAGSATVCSGTNSTLLTLSGYTGSITKWQKSTDNWVTPVDIANTANTFTATNLTTTTKYRAVLQSGVCSSTNSTDATVTVNPVSIGGTIAGSATVCAGTNSTLLTLSGYTGTIIKWQKSTDNWVTPVDIVNTSTTYTATNLGTTTKYRAVVQSGVCSAVNSTDATVTVNPLPVPTISGPANPVSGTSGNIYSTEAGMTGYLWTITAGGTIDLGQGTNSISVTWNSTGAQSVSVTYTNSNLCSAATPTVYPINVTAIPGPAGPITGTATVCQNQNGVAYSVAPIVNATSYVWSLPPGASIFTGSNTNSITVNFSTIASSGNITVYGTNILGNGTISPNYPVTVNTMPVPTLSGPNPVCVNSTGNVYSTQAGMSGYTWVISAGGTITAGPGTNAVTVTWNATGAQTLSVNYTNINGCTAAAPTVYNVTVNAVPIPTISGPTPVCVNSTGNVYSTQAGMSGYTWVISAGGTITAGPGTNAVTVTWNTAGGQTLSVNYTNANGCTAASPVVYNVTVNPTVGIPLFVLGATSSRCQGAGTVIYTATASNNTGITYILDPASLAAGNTIVAGTGAVTYVAGWVGVSMITVTASGCNGPSTAFHLATTNPRPGPSITGPASVCIGSTGNVYTTQAGMSGYTWIVSAGGTLNTGAGTNTITVTWNTVGAQTVSVNYTNGFGCPALAPTVYNVTVNALPVPTITGPTPVCMGSAGNVYTTQAGMTGYTWTVSAGGNLTGGTGTNAISVSWNTAGAQTVSVSYTNANGCTAAAPTVFNVTVNALPVPTITGQTSMCVNSGYYNYTTEAGMTNYVWNVSAGGVINFGSGTNLIQVSWVGAGAQTVSVTYSNGIGCNAAVPTVLNVTVNNIPNQAGTITGTANVCAGANGVAYSVAQITGATTYVWTLPPNATIATGAGTNSITVNYGLNALSGNITVYGNNLCGNGSPSPSFPVTITPIPDPAGAITGLSSVCQGASGVVYSVGVIANATGYNWTVPSGATIISGLNTNSITVDFSLVAVSGNITVLGTNSCGNGTVSPNFTVTVNPIPPAPVISAIGDTLTSPSATGNQWYFEGTLIAGATGQTWVAQQSGWYWDVVTINGCSSDASNHIYILKVGIDQKSVASNVVLYPNPNEGVFTLMFTSLKPENYNIRVFNHLGVQIFELKNIYVLGTMRQNIDLRPAPNGVYSIVISNDLTSVVKKIVINK